MSIHRARELRKTMTRQEVRLWLQLRQLKARDVHFRRQAPLLGYYPDFACFSARLIVEVDGSHHGAGEQAEHDRRRDAALTRAGFRTLRFSNEEVDLNLDRVVDAILQALAQPHPTASRPPSP